MKTGLRTLPWLLCTMIFLIAPSALAADKESSRIEVSINQAQELIDADRLVEALQLLKQTRLQFPANLVLLELHAQLLVAMERYGELLSVMRAAGMSSEKLNELRQTAERFLDDATNNKNKAIVIIQRRIRDGDFLTAIELVDKALPRYPDTLAQLYSLKGEALYKNNDLEAAEIELRKSLLINPLNDVAKANVEEIRTTLEAQTSKELALWISIAKDKVGDFIVTFLALFAAFLVNSLIAPILLRLKLNRARRSFENGDYDDFTDLIEGLLDEENFTVLRANFRFVLGQKGFDEVKQILNDYVVTLERLPTLQRILEREYEKMVQGN